MPETRRMAIVGYGKMGRLIEQFAPILIISCVGKFCFRLAHLVHIHVANRNNLDVVTFGNLRQVRPRHPGCAKARVSQSHARRSGE